MNKLQKTVSSFLFVVFLLLVGVLLPHKPLTPLPENIASVLGETNNQSDLHDLQIQPEAGKDLILQKIKTAQSSVHVAIYILSDKDVIQSLIDAKNRGVEVKVLQEGAPFGGGNLNKISRKQLVDAGIEVKDPPSLIALLHQKSIIIDQKELIILTLNLSESAFSKNRDYSIIDSTPEDVLEAEAIFQADWNRQPYQPHAAQLVISPDNSREKITILIKSAQSQLDLEDEVIEDSQIIELLGNTSKKLPVRVLLGDVNKIAQNLTSGQILKGNGVQVKYITSPYLHSKLILVDQKFAYLGSVNLTQQSMDRNRELGIIFSEPNFIFQLQEQFEKDWLLGKEL